jgi:hypothetical protein
MNRLLIGILTSLIFLFIGIFSSIKGIWLIVNYDNPYLFGFLFGGLGLLIGIVVYFRIFIAKKNKRFIDELPALMCLSIGFVGLSLLISPYLNQNTSKLELCENYSVIRKNKNVSTSSRNPKIYSLYVSSKSNSYRLITNAEFWDKTQLNDNVEICLYKSKIGFDFIKLKDNK